MLVFREKESEGKLEREKRDKQKDRQVDGVTKRITMYL